MPAQSGGHGTPAAVAIWVIQHVLDAEEAVGRLARALRPGGRLYALNSGRCVPTDRGWVDDGIDVPGALRATLIEENLGRLPECVTTPQLSAASVVQLLHRPLE